MCGKGCRQSGSCGDPLKEQHCYHRNRQCHLPHPSGGRDSERLPGSVLHRNLEIPGRQTQGASEQVRLGVPSTAKGGVISAPLECVLGRAVVRGMPPQSRDGGNAGFGKRLTPSSLAWPLACPSPPSLTLSCLPVSHPQRITVTSPGLQALLGGMPCQAAAQLQLSTPPLGVVNPLVLLTLAPGLSSRTFSIVASTVIWKLLLPALRAPVCLFQSIVIIHSLSVP